MHHLLILAHTGGIVVVTGVQNKRNLTLFQDRRRRPLAVRLVL